LERAERRGLAVPVGLGARERPGVAELRVQIERVKPDRCGEEQERREARERTRIATAPEQDRERGQQREADQPCPGRKAAKHSGSHRASAHRREERARGEREEEPVRVERREHVADRVERDVQDRVAGTARS